MTIRQLKEQVLAEVERSRPNWRRVRSLLTQWFRLRATQEDWRPSEFAMAVSQELPLMVKKLKALKARHRVALESLTNKGA